MLSKMNSNTTLQDKARIYLRENGLEHLLLPGDKAELSPEWDMLARLHKLIRKRKPFLILEFGSGFSSVVMASALESNWDEFQRISQSVQNRLDVEQPRLVSVETSKKWQDNTREKIENAGLADFFEIVFSRVTIAEHLGQLCHFYDKLPDVVPDFVYLDGPDPATVEGRINGLSFQNHKRTVMSGDILKYESTLIPGFFMIIDGRTNNARFLQRMLTRDYDVRHHLDEDYTTFELKESRLGRKNIYGHEAYSGGALQDEFCSLQAVGIG